MSAEFLQESEEKIAVKLCRLELNSASKGRWIREIQIMKKSVNCPQKKKKIIFSMSLLHILVRPLVCYLALLITG